MLRTMVGPIVLLFLLLFVVVPSEYTDAHDYINLIVEVQNYYGTASVLFVQSDSQSDLNATTLVNTWSRELSDRGVLSVCITFAELVNRTAKYKHRVHRPMYVVLLRTENGVEDFSRAMRNVDTSYPVWLVIFMRYADGPLEEFCQKPTGNPFNLHFNTEMLVACYDQPILREWYTILGNRTRTYDLATWTAKGGFVPRTAESLYGRRSNMFGETLRVATVEESPFISVRNGVLSEFFGEVLDELSKSMNFKMHIMDPVEAYGSWNMEEYAWTGVIGQLVKNRADFGVAEFTMTNHRLETVDFTIPLMLSHNRLYFKQPDESTVQWSGYFKAFHSDIWAVIISIILTTPILLTVIKTKGRVVMRILTENYVYVWGIFCQQGLSEFPEESTLRLAFLSIFVSALIVSSAYSASLISFLTVTSATLPFSTVEGFVQDGTYKLILFRNSADYDLFMNANDSVSLQMKNMMKKKQDLPLTVIEGFEQVCTEKVAFYTTEVIKDAMSISLPCKVVSIETGRADSLAMTLSKGNQYTGLMNYHLQRFHDNGILNRLKERQFVNPNPPDNRFTEVGLWGIAPILAVLAGGTFLGYFVLMIEKTYYYFFGHEETSSHTFCKTYKNPFHAKTLPNKKLPENIIYGKRHNSKKTKQLRGYWP